MSSALKFSLLFSGGVSSSLSGAIRGLSTDTKGLNRRIGDLNRTAGKIGEYRQLTAELNKLRTKMDEGGRSGAKAQAQWEKTAAKLRELSGELTKAGVRMSDLGASERKLARDTAILNSQMGHLNRASQFRQMREGAFSGWGSLVGIGLALGAPIKAAMGFEEAMADVRKVVDFASEGEFKDFEGILKSMAKTMPISQKGLAEIAAAGGQLGIAKDQLPDFIQLVGKMSTAFDMLPSDAGEAMAKLSNVYQIPINKLGDLGDAINHLSDNTAAKAVDMVSALGRMGGVAKQFGLTAVQAAALANSLIALGKPPEVAATGLNYMLQTLQIAPQKGEKFQQALKKIGMDANQLTKAIQEDAQGALLNFLKTLEKVPKAERAGVLVDLFGTEWADDLALLVGSLDQYEKALGLVGDQTDYAGSMQREFENRSRTTANALRLLGNRISNVAITIGGVLLPPLNTAMGMIGNVADKVYYLAQKNPVLTSTLVSLAAGLLAGGAGFKILAMGAKFVYGGLGEALSLFRFFNVALMASPVFWVAAGLLAVGVALWKLGVLRPMVEGVWSSLKAAVPLVRDALAPGFKAFKDAVAPLGPMLTRAGDSLNIHSWTEFGRLIGDVLGFAIVGTAENVGRLVKGIVWLGQSIGNAAGAVSIFIENGIAKIGSLATAVHTKATGIYTSIKDNWNLAISFLGSIDLYEVGAKIVNSLIEGIKALGGKLTAAFYDILPDFVKENSTVREMLGIDLKGAYGGARAGGGPVKTGKFYTVGEKGPELFAPSSAGKIIPNAGAAPTRRKTRDNFQHLEDTFADEPPAARPSAPVPAARPMPKAAAATKSVPNLGKRPSANPAGADMARRWQAAARPSAAPMPSGPRGGGASGGGGGITVNMTVNVNGSGKNAGEIKQAASEALAEGREKLKRSLEGLLRNERRLSFG